MTVTRPAHELQATRDAHQALAQIPLPAATVGLPIAQNLRALDEALGDVETARVRLLESHAERDDDGRPVVADGPGGPRYVLADEAAVSAEVAGLLSAEVTVELRPVPARALGDAPVAPRVLLDLGDVLELGGEVPSP